MKASEVRIGNWFLNKKGFHEVVTEIKCYTEKGMLNGVCFVFEPIPLTEEWLLKFGFKEEEDSDWYNKSVGQKKILSYNTNKRSFVIGHGFYWSNNFNTVSYIHQLQNLYFALTGKEL